MWKKIFYNNEETNYSVSTEGEIRNDKTNRILKGTYKTNEYHTIQLSINKQQKSFMVHRLVAEAFCDNPNHYNIVDHIDRNKYNNNYQNLRWVNSKANALNSAHPQSSNRIRKYYKDIFDENWVNVFGDNRYMINKEGMVVNKVRRNILVPQNRHGYQRVNLLSGSRSVHILVWESFNQQKIPGGKQIDHIDGNKKNNNLNNLRLVSPSENMKNAYNNGHQNQIKLYQYDLNGNLLQEYNTIQEACDAVGVTHAAIRTASERHGTCKGYYWLKENEKIEEILTEWIPDGFVAMEGHPTYCINKEGIVYNKRNTREVPIHYRANGITKFVYLHDKRIDIDILLQENAKALQIL